VLLCSVKSKFSQKGLIRRRVKVVLWPLPSWVRPKRITKRCNRHAKQERTNTKVFVRDATIKMTSPKCGLATAA